MESNFKMLAKTFYGMEGLLAEELKNMGAQDVEEGNRVVGYGSFHNPIRTTNQDEALQIYTQN